MDAASESRLAIANVNTIMNYISHPVRIKVDAKPITGTIIATQICYLVHFCLDHLNVRYAHLFCVNRLFYTHLFFGILETLGSVHYIINVNIASTS